MKGLLGRLFQTERRQYFTAIDIGSNAAIRSLLFERRGSAYAQIRKHHFELPRRDRDTDLIPLIGEHLRRVIFGYIRLLGRVPEVTVLGLGSCFTFSEVSSAQHLRSHPERVINAQELRSVLDEYRSSHRERVISQARWSLAAVTPFGVAIDGYPVQTLSRRSRGREIKMPLLATYALASYWQELAKLRSLFGGINIRSLSNQAAIAAAVVSLLGSRDALIVKIGAAITEVSLLEDSAIRASGRLMLGGDDVTRAIAELLSIGWREAEAMKCQSGRTVPPPRTAALITQGISRAVEHWIAALAKFLENDERIILPERLYLTGGGARLKAIIPALVDPSWRRGLSDRESLSVLPLPAEDIASKIFRNTESLLHGLEETALAALANHILSQQLQATYDS